MMIERTVEIVCLLIALPGLAAVAIGVLAWFRAVDEDYPPGHCTTCGYDLTSNLSNVCPECGDQVLTLPKNAGVFRLGEVRAGTFTVVNDRSGEEHVIISCRSRHQACALCDQL